MPKQPQETTGIRDFESFAKSLRNYEAWLGSGKSTDIDFFIHAAAKDGDRFMVMEFKQPGERLGTGQRMAFDALRRLGWTVLVVYGPDKDDMFVVTDGTDKPAKMDKNGIAALVESWWGAAKGGHRAATS